jgi:phenylalanine-4-hydroxylase
MVQYTQNEHALWRDLSTELETLHAVYACSAIREAQRTVSLPRERIPSLAEVSGVLTRATGFRMEPVAGLVPAREFFDALARGVFLSTEYIRDARTPHYTPAPDIVHELIGHAASLAHPGIAALNRELGRASLGASDDELRALERFYWFSLEFGLVMEDGTPKALGAGLLSSVAELRRACNGGVSLQPFSHRAVSSTPFRTDAMQDVLFVARSLDDYAAPMEATYATSLSSVCVQPSFAPSVELDSCE